MKPLACIAALALSAAPLAAPAQTMTTMIHESDLVVTGTGTASHTADQATFSVNIVTTDDVAATSTSKNNAIYNTLRDKLGGLGIASSAIHTRSYNVQYVPKPTGNTPPYAGQRLGYTTNRFLQIDCGVEGVGQAIDAAVAAGATDISNVQFGIKDRKSAYNEALAAAVADARSQANALAAAAGVRIVRIHTITTGVANTFIRPVAQMRLAGNAAPAPTVISPDGPVDITANVTVSWIIQ